MKQKNTLRELIEKTPSPFGPPETEFSINEFSENLGSLSASVQWLLAGVASCSPYLHRLMRRKPDLLCAILAQPLEQTLSHASEVAAAAAKTDSRDLQLKQLRSAKKEAALAIALADVSGVMSVMEAARALSEFADTALRAALAAAVKTAKLKCGDKGISILALGKLGGSELNYSSDIDLIVIFDPEKMGGLSKSEAQADAVKVARDTVSLLQSQTEDGYVFRTDLRLRPDPGVSALAISVQAAEAYYESYGQNWERMAYIKARPVAGDIELGKQFLKTLRPFIWRKFLDYAAIEDVQAVKRQIHSAKGGEKIEFRGHDIKIGRGGIREIEFYAQTQQLILGGKNPALRQRTTLEALTALHQEGHISAEAHGSLTEAYEYLRVVEHRLQMTNDAQTHRLPKAQEDLQNLARFVGAPNVKTFQEKMIETLSKVQEHYDNLFHIDADDVNSVGTLVFTGVDDHPGTLETLRTLGFSRVEEVSDHIRRWQAGGLRATRSERSRALLTKLMGPLLSALSEAHDPDEAFFAFEKFLSNLPAGVQFFSLLLNNIAIFDILIRIMTISPYLGRKMSDRINMIERLIENGLTAPPQPLETYAQSLQSALSTAPTYEEMLNLTRRWAAEAKMPITAQLAAGVRPTSEAAVHYTAIADTAIAALAPAAANEMRALHGDIKGSLAIIGLGRLGGGEMTATSDIDLMFIYDAPGDVTSDGKRSLDPLEYYTRLVRRIITALSASTQEGALYDVDMQLRPSGGAGPAAVSFFSFKRYYETDAWIWEVMALTKARVLTGETSLMWKIEKEIDTILRRPRDREAVSAAVHDMRRRLLDAKPSESPWDVKNVKGGLIDITFICQFLALVHADTTGPAPRRTIDAISWFNDRNIIPSEHADQLTSGLKIYEEILQAGRAATGGVFNPEQSGRMIKARMASIFDADGVEQAEERLIQLQSVIAQIYRTMIGIDSKAY